MSEGNPVVQNKDISLESWLKKDSSECPQAYKIMLGDMNEKEISEDTLRRQAYLSQVGRNQSLDDRRLRQLELEKQKFEIEAEERQLQGSSVNRYFQYDVDSSQCSSYASWASEQEKEVHSNDNLEHDGHDNQINIDEPRLAFNYRMHRHRKPIINAQQEGIQRDNRGVYQELLRRSVLEQDQSPQSSSTQASEDEDSEDEDSEKVEEAHIKKEILKNDIMEDIGATTQQEEDEDEELEDQSREEEQQQQAKENLAFEHMQIDIENDQDITQETSIVDINDKEDGEGEIDYTAFPFEDDLLHLSTLYSIVRRVMLTFDTVVYEAYCRCTGTHVALKLKAGWDTDRAREYELLSSVQDCSYIVPVHAYHEQWRHKTTCVVQHWVDSQPVLGKHLTQYMKELLLSIAYLHSRNILHRDIKQSNALWNGRSLQLIDLDLATLLHPRKHQRAVGTPGYMSPELVEVKDLRTHHCARPHHGYSYKTDVFSAGVILGQQLFKTSEDTLENNPHLVNAWRTHAMLHNLDVHPQTKQLLYLFVELTATNPQERITVRQALQHPVFKQE